MNDLVYVMYNLKLKSRQIQKNCCSTIWWHWIRWWMDNWKGRWCWDWASWRWNWYSKCSLIWTNNRSSSKCSLSW